MADEQDFRERRSTRSIYESYIKNSNGGNSRGGNKSHFESKDIFRSDFSRYSMHGQTVEAGSGCKWDITNCSGVPMDYEASTNTLYVDGSDAHTLLIGATGSKKSRLVVMPLVRTLAASGENMIICDPKGEIYKRTAGYLKQQGYNIHAINLREPHKGDGWNMLSVPYKLYLSGNVDKACEFINDMAINLMPASLKDPYWDYSARDMLFGLILLLFKICKEKKQSSEMVSMQGVLKLREELFCSSYSREIQKTSLWAFAKQDNLIRVRLNGTVICPENTLSCIVSTFDQHMSCFTLQPEVVKMLSCSTFDLQGIGFGKDAIYLIMPDEKSTYHKIITIFLKQIYESLIDNAFKVTEDNRYPVRINFILDEFSSLPAMSDFPQMITASRSRNIRFTLVIQSKHQLKQRYEEETETIMSNCINWMFLTSRETGLLQEISQLGGITGNANEPLISVSRLQHLDKEAGECLIFSGRKYPYIAALPDIDVYDQAQYTPLEMQQRVQLIEANAQYMQENFFEKLVDLSTEEPKETYDTENVMLDLEDDLDKLFDDLFPSEDESDE